ncbi:MAG TPA: murein biosynthesis integral membrane protein MurJ [Candidatus Limnocylindrales bacterium]
MTEPLAESATGLVGPAPNAARPEPPASGSAPPSTGRALARAGLVVTIVFFVSRLLGWLRLVLIGAVFGANADLDTFFAAFRIPDLIFQLVAAGALSSALIPIVTGLLATDEDARAWRVVSTVINLMMSALLVLSVALAVLAPQVVPLITPGFDLVERSQTVELTRVMLLSPILLALGSVATSILNAQGRFAASAIAPLVYNLAISFGAVFLAPFMGVRGLALAVVLGSAGHLAVQLPQVLRGGFRYDAILALDDPKARQALVLLAPRALGLGVSQLTFVVTTTLASGLQAGSISAFTFAFTLLQIPIGVIGVPLGVVIFPSMARELALGAEDRYVALLTRSLRLLLFVMLPIAALLAVLRRQAVAILFPGFDTATVDLTANALLFFLVGLAAHALIAVLARAFYARQDTRTPVAAAILAVVVNVSLAVVLVGSMGVAGLALAIAIGAWVEALLLIVVLKGNLPPLDLGSLVRVVLESGLGSLVAGAVALGLVYFLDGWIGPRPTWPLLVLQSAVAAAAGGLAFLAVAVALRIPELPTIVGLMVDLVRRRPAS